MTTQHRSKKLFQNSFYLMLSQVAMSGFGFFFWLINARLFTENQIGLATMLISALTLISVLSLAGFDVSLVRFLWHSKKRNAKINTAMMIVGSFSAVLAVGFILSISFFAPKLLFIHNNLWLMAGFVVFSITSTWNILTDSVFLAYRKPIYSFVISAVLSFEKMLLPFVVFSLGASAIFVATGLAGLTGLILSVWVMVKKFNYTPHLTIDRQVLFDIKGYSMANYIANISYLIPPSVIPFIVVGYLGAANAAYFYITFMISNILYVIPRSASRSLLAEGSHATEHLTEHLKKTIFLNLLLIIPAIVILAVGAPYILSVFGKNYVTEGVNFLRIMVFAGIAVSSYVIIETVFQVTKQLKPLAINSIAHMVIIIAGTFIALHFKLGLVGVGWAWFAGNMIASLIGFGWLFFFSQSLETDIKVNN